MRSMKAFKSYWCFDTRVPSNLTEFSEHVEAALALYLADE